MIVAERKPLDEILQGLAGRRRVLVLGCGGCVAVCCSGGEKQAELLADQLLLAAKVRGLDMQVTTDCITRQCDREFFDNMKHDLKEFDVVLSTACGVGVGYMTSLYPEKVVLPALNTTFYGANVGPGQWQEFCHGCGDCVLAWTGGICPIARCSKSLINGACGGTNHGKCEVSKEMDCAWYLIYKRLKELDKLADLRAMRPARQWSKDRGKGVRRLTHEELQQDTEVQK
jgi:hypothetical protein